MKRKQITSILLSFMLAASAFCTPFAQLPAYAAEEVEDEEAIDTEAAANEEAAAESDVTVSDDVQNQVVKSGAVEEKATTSEEAAASEEAMAGDENASAGEEATAVEEESDVIEEGAAAVDEEATADDEEADITDMAQDPHEDAGHLSEEETVEKESKDSRSGEFILKGVQPVTTEGQEALPEDKDGKFSDDLFADYVENSFGGQAGLSGQPGQKDYGRRRASKSPASNLSGIDRAVYDNIASCLPQIAAGERASTTFEISVDELGLEQTFWTAAELGVPSVFELDGSGNVIINDEGNASISEEAVTAISDRTAYNLSKVIDALLADHPYELYWHEKTQTTESTGYEITAFYDDTVEDYVAGIAGSFTISFPVAEEYSAGEYQVDTSIGQSVQTSVANANAIVEQYNSVSDYEKLRGYKDEICDLVSYNDEAAEGGVSYGNPWQMIWVFDGDPDTNVVCEGYSKAFKYLCDQTEFSGDISCITVTGTMTGGTGEGPHMWNIVNMDDGNNYLVDVTNCDEGTVGAPDLLFIAGYSSGNVFEGYVFNCADTQITYVYDAAVITLYGEIDLAVHETDIIYSGTAGTISWKFDKNGLLTVSGNGDVYYPFWEFGFRDQIKEVVIEEGITSILGLDHCPNLKKVQMPDGLTTILSIAFWKCPSLEEINIPDSVQFIGDSAFADCGSLKEISLNAEIIGVEAFRDCTGLETVSFGNNLLSIGNHCFNSCYSIKNIVLPEGLEEIGECAFLGCSGIESIVIPSTLSKISRYAFSETGIEYVEIRNGIQVLDDCAFFRCDKLKTISMPESMRIISDVCFSHCYSLESVVLNEGLERIGDSAFEYCPIKNLYIPASVTEIGKRITSQCMELSEVIVDEDNEAYASLGNIVYNKSFEEIIFAPIGLTGEITIPGTTKKINEHAFAYCGISKVNISNGVEELGTGCFQGCISLENVALPDGLIIIGEGAFSGCSSITSIQLPDSLKTIENTAFFHTGLDTVFIPANVESIGESVFSGSPLSEIDVADDNNWFSAVNGVLYDKELTLLITCPCAKTGEIVIPGSVSGIKNGAFESCRINSIIIPGSVESIPHYAFQRSELSDITIQEGVKSIGIGAFENCNNLEEIQFPSSLKTIEASAFFSCSSLRQVVLKEGMTVGDSAFFGCSQLSDIRLEGELRSIGSDAFRFTAFYEDETNWNNNLLYLDNWLIRANDQYAGEYIGLSPNLRLANGAFQYCENLTAVILPEGVTEISDSCFSGCRLLKKVVLPDSLTRIGDYAFEYSNDVNDFIFRVDDIIIPKNVSYVGKSVFSQLSFVQVYFTGDAPEFHSDFLFNTGTVNMHYPSGNDTWYDVIDNCYGNQDGDLPWFPYDPADLPTVFRITLHPTDVSSEAGKAVELHVEAEGEDLGYQWQWSVDGTTWKNCASIGYNTDTFSFKMKASLSGRQYRCVVSCGSDNLASNAALISLKTVRITKDPEDVQVRAGEQVVLSIETEGSDVTYQWQWSMNGTTWKNCTSGNYNTDTFSFVMKATLSGRQYRCRVTGGGKTLTSKAATITLAKAVEIISQPSDVEAPVGETVVFTVEAQSNVQGEEPLYQWQWSTNGTTWKNCTSGGYNTEAFSFKMKESLSGRQYRCKVTCGGETLISDAATITLFRAVEIISQPEDVEAAAGETVVFSVEAQSHVQGEAPEYQWQYSTNGTTWKNCTSGGYNTDTFSFTMKATLSGRQYRCKVTCGGETVISEVGTITLK